MGAFIVAGGIEFITVAAAGFSLFAAGMSDVPNEPSGARGIFWTGTVIAGLVAASHWLPTIHW